MSSPIGGYCLFSTDNCTSCLTGTLIGRTLNSCGICDTSTGFRKGKYMFREYGLFNNSVGALISNRDQAKSFVINSTLGFNSIGLTTAFNIHNDFDEKWGSDTDNKMFCVVSLDERGGLFGFYTYQLSEDMRTIRLYPMENSSITRTDIINAPIQITVNTDGTLSFREFIFQREN